MDARVSGPCEDVLLLSPLTAAGMHFIIIAAFLTMGRAIITDARREKMSPAMEVTGKETEPTTVAFVAVKGPFTLISESFGKLYGWIAQKGYVPSGPPSGIYFTTPGQVPEEEMVWELRSPIAGNFPDCGPDEQGLGVKKLPAALVASALHKGPFEEIGGTYGALAAWIAEKGYESAGPQEEVYLTDPMETPPDQLLTEVRFPIRKNN